MIKKINTKIPNKNIITTLEGLLDRAKKGDIQAVAIAIVNHRCTTSNVFDGNYYPLALIGELRLLERDVVDICCKTRRQVDWDFVEE